MCMSPRVLWSRALLLGILTVALLPGALATAQSEPLTVQRPIPQVAAEANPTVPFYPGLGDHHRDVTTSSALAQQYFNQGLAFLYGFNHDEAIRSFESAGKLDPNCAMAWWGVAFANGPHINKPAVPAQRAKAAWDALQKALRAAVDANHRERALVEALSKRYAESEPESRKPLDEAFAAAMRKVWQDHPRDADVGALFAESLMDLRPWDLWSPDGQPRPGTDEIVATLERVLELSPRHPLALHLYIHAVEASPQPEKANDAADRLRSLMPGLGHMVHMPSHIDVRCGRWPLAAKTNELAILADTNYCELSGRQDFYHIYMAHNQHMLAFSTMMIGQRRRSIDAMTEMARGLPDDWVKENADFADGYTAMPLEVLVRFGHWSEVLNAPEPAEHLPIARGLWRCARGIAYAAQGDVASAIVEQQRLRELALQMPERAQFGNNKGRSLMNVAAPLLAGEILYREGKVEDALENLRAAVSAEDTLVYSEPPDWLIPTRHALGATLLNAGRPIEAEQTYRDDLRRLPNNGWSLYGLARSLELQEKHAEAAVVRERFNMAWRDADIEIDSSCLCLPGKP